MIVAQTFFDEFHPGETVPPTRYAPESITVMAAQGMVMVTVDPAPEPKPKRGKATEVAEEVTDGAS